MNGEVVMQEEGHSSHSSALHNVVPLKNLAVKAVMHEEGRRSNNSAQHNVVFAAWLVSKYGQSFLRSQGGVVDVAGGQGVLSFELSVRYGVSSTVVDPRIVPLKGLLRRKMKKLHRSRAEGRCELDRSPLMTMLRGDISLLVKDDGVLLDAVQAAIDGELVLPFGSICSTFPPAQEEHKRQLDDMSMLVGMHSDQATEHIITHALRLNKPFAVVPCCLFSKLFPDRTITVAITDGDTEKGKESEEKEERAVANYGDFVQYLQALDGRGRIRRADLPFIGRNVVLFMLPEDCDSACGGGSDKAREAKELKRKAEESGTQSPSQPRGGLS